MVSHYCCYYPIILISLSLCYFFRLHTTLFFEQLNRVLAPKVKTVTAVTACVSASVTTREVIVEATAESARVPSKSLPPTADNFSNSSKSNSL